MSISQRSGLIDDIATHIMKTIQNETVEFQTSGKGDVYISCPFFFVLKNKDYMKQISLDETFLNNDTSTVAV